MSTRKYLQHPLLVAALALGGIVMPPAHAVADEDASPEDASHQVIIARGNGSVRVRPDSVRVDIGAESQATTLDEARRQVSGAVTRVLDALHKLNLPELTIETRQVRFNPVYGTARDGHVPLIIGFSASNHVLVTAKHAPEGELAARSAQVVDAALDAGATNVGSIDFFLADSSRAEDEALTLAVQNAESDAQTIAKAARVTLSGLIWLEEGSATRVPRAFALEAPTIATPIEVGDITIESNVTAKYAFH